MGATRDARTSAWQRRSAARALVVLGWRLLLVVRVLDDAEDGAAWFGDGGDADVVADIVGTATGARAGSVEVGEGLVDVGDAPVRDRPRRRGVAIREQAKLVAGDGEPDVEGLIEVGLDAEEPGVPSLRRGEVGGGVDDRAKAEEHGLNTGRSLRHQDVGVCERVRDS